MKTTAVTYHRVSTADQRPELAREELRAAAAARGLDLVEEVEETGSGARNDRPGLRRVLELVRAGKVSHVLVWKLDRFGRSALDLEANLEQLREAGATFVATSQGMTVSRSSGAAEDLFFRVLSAVAQFERDLIRERTALGLERARAAGKHLGRRSRIDHDTLMRALRMRELGKSWSHIAGELGESRGAISSACMRKQPALFRGRV